MYKSNRRSGQLVFVSCVLGFVLFAGSARAEGVHFDRLRPFRTGFMFDLGVPGLAHAQEHAAQSEPAVGSAAVGQAEYQPYERNPNSGPGVELGFRTGFGLPFGNSTGVAGDDFDRVTAGQVPLWFDLGMHLGQRLTVAMYLSYGIGIASDEVADACDAAQAAQPGIDVSCRTSDVRIGTEFLFHILPGSLVDPWVGVGTGWEWFSVTQSYLLGGESASTTFTVSGFETFNLQAGVDFKLADKIGLGPFVTFSNGIFGSAKVSCSNANCVADSAEIAETASHQWLMFGAKFTARL